MNFLPAEPKEYNVRKQTAHFTMLLMLLATTLLAFFYFSQTGCVTRMIAPFFSSGHFFVLFGVVFLLCVYPVCRLTNKSLYLFVWLGFVHAILSILLVADLIVYSQFSSHINWIMVDLFLNGGNAVSLPYQTWIGIVGIIILIVVFSIGIVYFSRCLARHHRVSRRVWIFLGLVYILTQVCNMVCSVRNISSVINISECLPLYYPLRANKLLQKLGVNVAENTVPPLEIRRFDLKYPLNLVQTVPIKKKYNIVFLLSDGLRRDLLTPEVMPQVSKWSEQQICFSQHTSASISTFAGIFGLFYGLPSTYWHLALANKASPILIDTLLAQGYDVQAFATATLQHPELDQTVFSRIKDLRVASKAKDVFDGDMESLEDFKKYLQSRPADKPFFSFVFLDSTHSFGCPKTIKRFEPAWQEPHYLELTNSLNPIYMQNLYKNSAYWVDSLLAKAIKSIQEAGIYDETIIVLTSDHGQEINETKKNHWGHGSAFTSFQRQVPLVIHWPGKQPKIVSDVTCGYDIPVTILRNALGVTNPEIDVGIGLDLFDTSRPFPERDWLLVGGYYRFAVVEKAGRIIQITDKGGLKFLTENYDPHPDQTHSASMLEALKMTMRYREPKGSAK